MKKSTLILIVAGILPCVSCEDNNPDVPQLSVAVDTENATGIDESGVPVFKKGSSVKFTFEGQADMITFYSGEPGMMYQHKDRTKLQGFPFMQFNTQMENGNMPPGFLSVLLSSDFAGFTKDKENDARNISDATWTDVTEQCNIPLTQTTQLSPRIDLSAYAGKPLYVAFRYNRPANTDFPRYQIKNFRIQNEADGTAYEIMTTRNAGWTAFDFNAPANTDPYASTGGGTATRIWDLRNATSDDRISIGYNSQINNNDWAITAAIDLTSVSPDLGQGIKAYNDDRLKEFNYIFNTVGTFTVSFLTTNSRYSETETSLKEVTIRITE